MDVLSVGWNKIFWTFLFVQLFTTPVLAQDILQHITLQQYPPGSLVIKHTGVRGFLYSQAKSQIFSLHRDYLDEYHPYDIEFARKSRLKLHQTLQDASRGGQWWTRHWWSSFPEEKGGAPKTPIVWIHGPDPHLLIDIGFAYLTSEFKFKLREYKVNITDVLEPSTIPDFLENFVRLYNWNLRIKPSLRFSSSQLIRRGRLSFIFEYSRVQDKLLSVEFYVEYSRTRGGSLGIRISFLKF